MESFFSSQAQVFQFNLIWHFLVIGSIKWSVESCVLTASGVSSRDPFQTNTKAQHNSATSVLGAHVKHILLHNVRFERILSNDFCFSRDLRNCFEEQDQQSNAFSSHYYRNALSFILVLMIINHLIQAISLDSSCSTIMTGWKNSHSRIIKDSTILLQSWSLSLNGRLSRGPRSIEHFLKT